MSFPWATEAGTGGCAAAKPSGRAFVRSNSAAPTTGPREEFQATPLGKRHTPEVHASPHVNRKRCHGAGETGAVGGTTGSSAAPVTNASITSAQSTNSQHSPGKKFVRAASASGNMMGGRVTTEKPQRDEKGGATPRGRKTVAPSNADGGVGQFVGGSEGHGGMSAGRASSVDVSASCGRKPTAAPVDKGTYDISTLLTTKRRVQPSFVDPNEFAKVRPVFQRNDENTAPLYRPMISRRPTVPAISTNGINIPKTNDKAEFTRELNKKVFKPEKRIFKRQDNVILGSKSTPVPEGAAPSAKAPLDTGLGAGRKRVATPQADEGKRELQPAKGLKQVPTPARTTTVRGVKPVAGAPQSTISTSQE